MAVPAGAVLEVWRSQARATHDLNGDRVTIGRDADNVIALVDDSTCSRTHAVIERVGSSWCVRDLGSCNGTFVNGERLWGERALRNADEVRIGRARIVLRAGKETVTRTETVDAAPSLTRRERDVLIALCQPLLAGNLFTEPASIREVAGCLSVTEAAVKQHVGRLYDKFALFGDDRRRSRLANEALRLAAVTLADLVDE